MPNEELKDDGQQQASTQPTKNLLQSKRRNSRLIIRPESAKPKVGYDGKPTTTLTKLNQASALTGDLSS